MWRAGYQARQQMREGILLTTALQQHNLETGEKKPRLLSQIFSNALQAGAQCMLSCSVVFDSLQPCRYSPTGSAEWVALPSSRESSQPRD